MKALLIAATTILLVLTSYAGQRSAVVKDGMNRIHPADGDYLVALHGWTTGYDNMRVARSYFHKAGYHVIGIRYPSRTAKPKVLLDEHIRPAIAKHCTDPTRKIHFVTHSLGGLLLRDYLNTDRPKNLGRVVMLAPPNHGIEIIDRFADHRSFAKFFGPTVLELHTGEDSWPNRLGKADYPLGIIMGKTRVRVPFTSRVLPGFDDGIVSLASGTLKGMRELIEMNAFHTSLPVKYAILDQAKCFIENGEFAAQQQPERRAGWLKKKLRARAR